MNSDRELFRRVLHQLERTIAYSNEEMQALDRLKQEVRDRLDNETKSIKEAAEMVLECFDNDYGKIAKDIALSDLRLALRDDKERTA